MEVLKNLRVLGLEGEEAVNKVLENLPKTKTDTVLGNAVNLVLFLVGAGAVVMIIYSGFQLVVSAGNPGAVTRARNTLVYSVVGLFLAVAAYAIVNYVVKLF